MRLRLFLLVLAVTLGAALQPASAQYASQTALEAAIPARKVITWVPPYGIAQAKARLPKFTSGYGPRNGLTHLALQFWTPTANGGLTQATRYGTITPSQIQGFATWGHRYGIKVLLCVYNGENGWDWSLTQAAINPANQTKFINALINRMQTFHLDGIDIDLEGSGNEYPADKANYVAFVTELARRVHLLDKIVTVDSFHYIWNAPNQTWWADLFPHVDGINSMGYEDLGRNAPTWQKYLAQKNRAGLYSAKLQIGLPSYLPSWQGNTTLQQVAWFGIPQAGRTGIAIWDAQFTDPSWDSPLVWKVLKGVRDN